MFDNDLNKENAAEYVYGCVSDVWDSTALTSYIASSANANQSPPYAWYIMPNQEQRKLRIRLMLEELLETITALGFKIAPKSPVISSVNDVDILLHPNDKQNLENVIDGCCDLIYVTTGTMWSCGVPDKRHLIEVSTANESKFPDGKPIVDPNTGKYLKPDDWVPPNHTLVQEHFTKCVTGLSPKDYVGILYKESFEESQ